MAVSIGRLLVRRRREGTAVKGRMKIQLREIKKEKEGRSVRVMMIHSV